MSADQESFTSFIAPSIDELNNLFTGYQFEKFIAQGGMGAVYLARQTSLDRQVAVKILPREFGEDEEFKQSFQTEAKLMAKLNSPNLIGIYDFGSMDGMLYIIMEYVEGNSLYDSANGKAIEQKTAVNIITGICSGLEHAHNAGILHRDIKPANILLNHKAIPKVGDFGLARPSSMTESGTIFGTPGYSAPEVVGAPHEVDNRTDIFAVGVMFYELLAGQMPSPESYVSVTEFGEVDARFDKVIQKAIHPNIHERHTSAKLFVEEINAILEKPEKTNKLLVGTTGQGGVKKVPSVVSGARTLNASSTKSAISSIGKTRIASPAPAAAGNSKLVRNIVIIIALLGAIYGVLQMKDDKEKDIAEQERLHNEQIAEIRRINEERKADFDKEIARISPTQKSQTSQPKPKPKPAVVTESNLSPMAQLRASKQRLANGGISIDMMPKTAFTRDQGSRIMMFIDMKMSWDEADRWARSFGGYLAVCKTESELNIFMKQMPDDAEDAWLGAGCSGDKGWCWVDDTPWSGNLSLSPTYKRSFAKLSKYGSLGKKEGKERLNFFVEWRADGSNPSNFDSRLKRAKSTLSLINPKYPPGTVTIGSRNYCIIMDSMKQEDARRLAESAGGHLLAISDEEEKFGIEELISTYCKEGCTLWTGGNRMPGSIWAWDTGEKWLDLDWVNNHPMGRKYVAIHSGIKLRLKNLTSSVKADGFIIEWSSDSSQVSNGGVDQVAGGNEVLTQLNTMKGKLKQLIKDKQTELDTKQVANAKKLSSDLESYLRTLPSRSKTAESAKINRIIARVKKQSKVPLSIEGAGTSRRSRDFVDYAVRKRSQLDLEYKNQLEAYKVTYVNRVRKLITEAEADGQIGLVRNLRKEVSDSLANRGLFGQNATQ